MKTLQIVLVLSAIVALTFAANASFGSKLSSSKLASTQNVTIFKKTNAYQDVTVNFPLSGQTNTKIIRFINVTDRFTNSSGPTSTLWSGGPGYTFASVYIKTQYSQGANVSVQFYTD
ncbi:uncharacterized protein Dana_GF15061 [Drosophila ananassae]|uniref:Salivary secreted peptide n=1 Tax=Drosophila ananassae TaxID=7217 RepID=B3MM30_DROAN|nr:uncharacterized protein LOC6497875 [Drosophila ananassae]EDV30845.1 uncharacterized protein Dana_GF15061 [Drosophila ananassae]